MGRKRNQGKARKAAKAKAKQETEERENNNQTMTREQSQEEQMRTRLGNGNLQRVTATQCNHGFEFFGNNVLANFAVAFIQTFHEAIHRGTVTSLIEAKDATMDEYAEVWNDSTKMESVISLFLCSGTSAILEGDYDHAKAAATVARYMEQWAAVYLHKTQAVQNYAKVNESYQADMHTLVKFFRHRIPCSCLNDKYEEVKDITKIGICYNPQCKFPYGQVERSKTKYCSLCRCMTYCSRECQKTDWAAHKPDCDRVLAIRAKFEAAQMK